METWTKPLPLQGFPSKALLSGVGITNKRQGGLRKSYEAKAFRRKLMGRSIALRGDTKFIPHAGRHNPSVCARCAGLQVAELHQLLHESTRQLLELSTGSVECCYSGRAV